MIFEQNCEGSGEWTKGRVEENLQAEGTHCANVPVQKCVWLEQGKIMQPVERPQIMMIGVK